MTKEEIKVLAYNTIAYAAERLNDNQYSVGWINGVTSIVNEIIEAMEAEEVKAHIDKVILLKRINRQKLLSLSLPMRPKSLRNVKAVKLKLNSICQQLRP